MSGELKQRLTDVIDWAPAVIWHFSQGHPKAIQPGSFRQRLMDALDAADRNNRLLIGEGFPVLVTCFSMAKDISLESLVQMLEDSEEAARELGVEG